MKSRGIFVGSGMKYMSRYNATMTKGTLLCLWNMDFHSSLIKWHIVLGTNFPARLIFGAHDSTDI